MTRPLFRTRFALVALASLTGSSQLCAAADQLTSSQITQVVREVNVIDTASKAQKPAVISAEFRVPDILKTGLDSRAEMIAPDRTVTRVGANTLFSFEPKGRQINLEKGSLLFHSPAGKGGGSVRTASVTASVMGTTLMVGTTENGGFKVMLLEGTGKVRTANGTVRTLQAGQLVYALPGGNLSPVMAFRLGQVVKSSQLVSGFPKPLASLPKIQAAILRQEMQVQKGRLQDTGIVAGNNPETGFRVDVVSRETRVQPARAEGSALLRALNSDTVLGPISSDRLFTGAFGDFIPDILKNLEGTLTPDSIGGSNFIPGADFTLPGSIALFAARNLTLESPIISVNHPGANLFLASNSIFVPGTTHVTSSAGPVGFLANQEFRFAPGAILSFEAPEAFVAAFGGSFAPSLRATQFEVGDGALVLSGINSRISNDLNKGVPGSKGGDLNVYAPNILLQEGAGLFATGHLDVLAGRDLNIQGVFFSPPNQGEENRVPPVVSTGLQAFGPLDVRAGGNLLLSSTLIVSDRMSLRADQDLRASETTFQSATLQFSESSPLINGSEKTGAQLSAGSVLDLRGTQFVGIADISLQARTLALSDINFQEGSRVLLRSDNGQLAPEPNTNKPVRPGFVNFVRDVRYGGQLMGGASPIPSNVKIGKR